MGSCKELKKRYPQFEIVDCCNSCHEDSNEHDVCMCSLTVEGDDFEVCCTIANAYRRAFKIQDLSRAS